MRSKRLKMIKLISFCFWFVLDNVANSTKYLVLNRWHFILNLWERVCFFNLGQDSMHLISKKRNIFTQANEYSLFISIQSMNQFCVKFIYFILSWNCCRLYAWNYANHFDQRQTMKSQRHFKKSKIIFFNCLKYKISESADNELISIVRDVGTLTIRYIFHA